MRKWPCCPLAQCRIVSGINYSNPFRSPLNPLKGKACALFPFVSENGFDFTQPDSHFKQSRRIGITSKMLDDIDPWPLKGEAWTLV